MRTPKQYFTKNEILKGYLTDTQNEILYPNVMRKIEESNTHIILHWNELSAKLTFILQPIYNFNLEKVRAANQHGPLKPQVENIGLPSKKKPPDIKPFLIIHNTHHSLTSILYLLNLLQNHYTSPSKVITILDVDHFSCVTKILNHSRATTFINDKKGLKNKFRLKYLTIFIATIHTVV